MKKETHPRWIIILKYKSNLGILDIVHHIEELDELPVIVEQGPDWNCLIDISITLNEHRRSYDITIEEARKL